MKKLFTIILALAVALSVLAACGAIDNTAGDTGKNKKTAAPADSASPAIDSTSPAAAATHSPTPPTSPTPTIPSDFYIGNDVEDIDTSNAICVDANSSGSQNGTPSEPYRTIQAAVDAASDSGIDVIAVARGTYYEAVQISQKKVRLLGGFAGDGDFASANARENETIIEGTSDAPCFWINIDAQAISGSLIIRGFTIRGGQRGIELSGGWSGYLGDIVIENNVIEENGTRDDDQRGGGISLDGNNVTIRSNLIRNNEAVRGAAIGATSDTISDFLIVGNRIENNRGYGDHAGGVIINGTGMIAGNIFDGNVTDADSSNGYGWGGAITIVNYDTSKLITLSHNVWRNNYAPSRGGAVFVDEAAKVQMVNELFYNNSCDDSGSAIYVDQAWTLEPSILYMDNCTVSNNSSGAALYVEASSAYIQNCIFWNNGDDFEVADGGSITVDYTLSQQGFDGTGNITSDPLFADAANGDFHVKSTNGRYVPSTGSFATDSEDSPAIDAGHPSSDFSKEPEPNGSRVNLGCYGNTAEASKSPG